MGTGMDDSFAFRTTVPIRRRPDPIVVKAAIALGIILLAIGLFALGHGERGASLHGATGLRAHARGHGQRGGRGGGDDPGDDLHADRR